MIEKIDRYKNYNKKYKVEDVKTVEEFLEKYLNRDNLDKETFEKHTIPSYKREFDELGFILINKIESKIDKTVAFYKD